MKTQGFAVVVGLTWLSIASAGMAQPRAKEDADSAKAAARFQQGVELYREGSYEGALAEFRKAYQISPSYRVLYNIAQAQYALHDFVGAYRSLVQYLGEGGGEIAADRRAQVDEMSARLAERIAHLEISTNVTGADIRVDDVSVGTSPLPGPVPVNVGPRRVRAVKVGAPVAARMLTVAGKEHMRVDLHIDEPVAASARVESGAAPRSPLPTTIAPTGALVLRAEAPTAPSRAGLMVSLSTTAVLAVATGVCGYLALGAQKDLKNQLNVYPNTKARIEDARTKSKNYGYVTDALGAATIISGGMALYFALSHGGAPQKAKSRNTDVSVVLAPTVGGMVLQGSF